jgi:hypothetical protein
MADEIEDRNFLSARGKDLKIADEFPVWSRGVIM